MEFLPFLLLLLLPLLASGFLLGKQEKAGETEMEKDVAELVSKQRRSPSPTHPLILNGV